jgi:sulfur carrier protein ThiS
MQIIVETDSFKKKLELQNGKTISDVIDLFKLNEETFFIKRNGALCHPKTVLSDGDELRLVGIIYGG